MGSERTRDGRNSRNVLGAKRGVGQKNDYLYVISGHKEKNPAAAMALIERLSETAKKRPVKKP